MNKKGITWSTIIYAIIAVIVLITILWVFREQMNDIYKSLTGILKTTTAEGESVSEGFKELIGKSK